MFWATAMYGGKPGQEVSAYSKKRWRQCVLNILSTQDGVKEVGQDCKGFIGGLLGKEFREYFKQQCKIMFCLF